MVGRWLTPVAFLVGGLYVRYYDTTHTDRQLVLPGVDLIAGPSPTAQGTLTWQVLLGIAALLAVWGLFETVRDWRRRHKGEQGVEE